MDTWFLFYVLKPMQVSTEEVGCVYGAGCSVLRDKADEGMCLLGRSEKPLSNAVLNYLEKFIFCSLFQNHFDARSNNICKRCQSQ